MAVLERDWDPDALFPFDCGGACRGKVWTFSWLFGYERRHWFLLPPLPVGTHHVAARLLDQGQVRGSLQQSRSVREASRAEGRLAARRAQIAGEIRAWAKPARSLECCSLPPQLLAFDPVLESLC